MNMMLELMATAMVGDEAEWARMSPETRASWRETARRGSAVVGKYIQGLEVERDRLRLTLRQIADPRQGDREFTAQGLAAVARTALLDD